MTVMPAPDASRTGWAKARELCIRVDAPQRQPGTGTGLPKRKGAAPPRKAQQRKGTAPPQMAPSVGLAAGRAGHRPCARTRQRNRPSRQQSTPGSTRLTQIHSAECA